MKVAFESTNQVRNCDQVFSKFSENDILSTKSMNLIRGGDGGENVIIIPPPPRP
jgi:hypothetical protein